MIKSIEKTLIYIILAQEKEEKYKIFINLNQNLPRINKKYMIPRNKVYGCINSIWIFSSIKNNILYFKAESNNFFIRGLLSLILSIYCGLSIKYLKKVNFFNILNMLKLKNTSAISRNNTVTKIIQYIYHKI